MNTTILGWAAQAKHFAKAHSVLVFDNRGVGNSRTPRGLTRGWIFVTHGGVLIPPRDGYDQWDDRDVVALLDYWLDWTLGAAHRRYLYERNDLAG